MVRLICLKELHRESSERTKGKKQIPGDGERAARGNSARALALDLTSGRDENVFGTSAGCSIGQLELRATKPVGCVRFEMTERADSMFRAHSPRLPAGKAERQFGFVIRVVLRDEREQKKPSAIFALRPIHSARHARCFWRRDARDFGGYRPVAFAHCLLCPSTTRSDFEVANSEPVTNPAFEFTKPRNRQLFTLVPAHERVFTCCRTFTLQLNRRRAGCLE